ncbi:MAG: hypothetical protein KKF52_04305 [Nanoarchaeota archaeon]|nr:hypothetical protein [Nanoarchaeota archaeon]MBU4352624.1 hypothetical protein [Nanoarchaeota archaeon]
MDYNYYMPYESFSLNKEYGLEDKKLLKNNFEDILKIAFEGILVKSFNTDTEKNGCFTYNFLLEDFLLKISLELSQNNKEYASLYIEINRDKKEELPKHLSKLEGILETKAKRESIKNFKQDLKNSPSLKNRFIKIKEK